MKIINASMTAVGSKERTGFSLPELMLRGCTLEVMNKTVIIKGVPYSLESLQFDILDAPANEPPSEKTATTAAPITTDNNTPTNVAQNQEVKTVILS